MTKCVVCKRRIETGIVRKGMAVCDVCLIYSNDNFFDEIKGYYVCGLCDSKKDITYCSEHHGRICFNCWDRHKEDELEYEEKMRNDEESK